MVWVINLVISDTVQANYWLPTVKAMDPQLFLHD